MAAPAVAPKTSSRGLLEAQPPRPSQPTSFFDKAARLAAYVYLRRVPILVSGIMIVLPLAALLPVSPVTALLQNLFLVSPIGIFWTTVVSLLLSWSALLTSRVVVLNGEERFGLPQKYTAREQARLHRSFLLVMLVSLPVVGGYFTQRHDFSITPGDFWRHGIAVACGIVCAYLLIYLALFAAILIAPKRTQTSVLTFPCPPFMRRWLDWANARGALPTGFLRLGLWIRSRLSPSLWAGYISPRGFLWGGQWVSLTFAVATFAVYVGIDLYTRVWQGETTAVPALVFVLLLLLNVNWILSGLAFFLDRYRIPLVIPILVLCVGDSFFPASDHYYNLKRGVAIETVHPGDVLRARAREHKPIVVIATAGGGIQAAAWTTQVLAGLEHQSQQWGGPRFSDSVTLISSVSGGATGAMFYLNLYHPNNEDSPFDENGLNGLTAVASQSSLNEVAWALVYHDLPKIFAAPSESTSERLFDRGYMLEETWRNRGNIQADLSNWRLGVAEGLRPAAIFNGTINETGEPLAMATTDMKTGDKAARRRTFYELYPDSDLPVVTAVRLGATFPYVTPSARAISTKPEYHVIDGGYYDNYGVASAVAWLDEGLTELQANGDKLPEVLVIQIRSFPDDAVVQPTTKGWFFQTYAPIDGLLNVRTTAQLIRDREELNNFALRWRKPEASGKKPGLPSGSQDRIHFATFEFVGHRAPLSWAMNPRQINEISIKWKDIEETHEQDLIEVHCFFDPAYQGCAEIRKGPW